MSELGNTCISTPLTVPRESLSGICRSEGNDEGGEERLEVHGSPECGVVKKRMRWVKREVISESC